MVVAATYKDGNVYQHFGTTPQFTTARDPPISAAYAPRGSLISSESSRRFSVGQPRRAPSPLPENGTPRTENGRPSIALASSISPRSSAARMRVEETRSPPWNTYGATTTSILRARKYSASPAPPRPKEGINRLLNPVIEKLHGPPFFYPGIDALAEENERVNSFLGIHDKTFGIEDITSRT